MSLVSLKDQCWDHHYLQFLSILSEMTFIILVYSFIFILMTLFLQNQEPFFSPPILISITTISPNSVTKCKLFLLARRSHFTKLRPFVVSIDGCQVHSVKGLGIILDNTLSSTAHMSKA